MSSSNAQSKDDGALSQESAPQIVVRVGQYFGCSDCGVTVEIPVEVVGRLVIPVDHSPQKPSDPEMPPLPQPPKAGQAKQSRAARSNRRRIDGLVVLGANEMERAFAWVSFHFKLLGLQGSEVKRLKTLFKKRRRHERLAPQSSYSGDDRAIPTKKKTLYPTRTSA
ncbi:hypothetical protein [Bremerella alba]|uniref:Uncharacterized protein n=1 Tax=Bremerella alba TaxID=980252 RepID=A0A7V8V949_9BACT|nr:hypothetical protein [Bremerella alba]MBA2117193.1 hypothetical protein [Bremerella alba]